MAEMILPGVYIETRAEGLIAPGRVTVGNVGVIGTASKGEIGVPVLLSNYEDAQRNFGNYDSFYSDDEQRTPRTDSLTLVRALELIFANGATSVYAVRIANQSGGNAAAKAAFTLKKGVDDSVTLKAKSEGKWGNDLQVNVSSLGAGDAAPFIEDESVAGLTLKHHPVLQSARNSLKTKNNTTGITRTYGGGDIVYAGGPTADQVKIDPASGVITFPAGVTADQVTASYSADRTLGVKVTVRLDRTEEVYTVISGEDLAADVKADSALIDADAQGKPAASSLPDLSSPATIFANLSGGKNGEIGAVYSTNLDKLLNENVHIIVAAGQDESLAGALNNHCQKASSDLIQRDRIAVVGSSRKGNSETTDHFLDRLQAPLASDRLIFVAPGIRAVDTALDPPKTVTLPGAYAAAAVAGLLASLPAHVDLTNKIIGIDGLEEKFNRPQKEQLILGRVLAIEDNKGFRIVQGLTTDDRAFRKTPIRRIVDFAKFGVRSAAQPYIGLLNNERVRGALQATINSFLTEMVEDEMLQRYTLTVSATRDEEKKGIANVTIGLQPTFSIDFIKVTMILN